MSSRAITRGGVETFGEFAWDLRVEHALRYNQSKSRALVHLAEDVLGHNAPPVVYEGFDSLDQPWARLSFLPVQLEEALEVIPPILDRAPPRLHLDPR